MKIYNFDGLAQYNCSLNRNSPEVDKHVQNFMAAHDSAHEEAEYLRNQKEDEAKATNIIGKGL